MTLISPWRGPCNFHVKLRSHVFLFVICILIFVLCNDGSSEEVKTTMLDMDLQSLRKIMQGEMIS